MLSLSWSNQLTMYQKKCKGFYVYNSSKVKYDTFSYVYFIRLPCKR